MLSFKKNNLTIIILTIVALVYFLTLSQTVFGGDSGDFLSAILTLSFPHPPGYPLFTILGIAFAKLLFFLDFVKRVSSISAISTLISLFLLYKIFEEIEVKPDYREKFLFLLSLLFIATNYVIWLYSIVPEVFALNAFIVVAIYYFAIKIYKKKAFTKYLILLAFFIGLGFSHHHTFVLILPSVLYLFFKVKSKFRFLEVRDLVFTGLSFIAGLLPFIYLPVASYLQSEINWGDATNIKGFLDIFLRKGYGTFFAGPFVTQNPYHRLLQFKNILIYLISDFTLPIVILIFFGVLVFFKKGSAILNSLLIALFFFGPFFFFYANFPLSSPFMFATLERFFFSFYIFLVFPLYFGLKLILKFVLNIRFIPDYAKRYGAFYFYFILFLILLTIAIRNFNSLKYLRTDRTAENFAQEILDIATSNSIILLSNDTVLFNTQYLFFYKKYYLKDQPDNKIVVHASKLEFPFYYKILKKHYPKIKIPQKSGIKNFILENFKNFSIYSNTQINLEKDNLTWRPYGLLFKLEYNNKGKSKEYYFNALDQIWKKSISSQLLREKKELPLKFKNLFTYDILKYYSIAHQNTAYEYLKNKLFDKALIHLQAAKNLYPEDPDSDYLLAVYYYKIKNCDKSLKVLKQIIAQKKDPLYFTFLKTLETCVSKKNKYQIEELLREFKDLKLSDL